MKDSGTKATSLRKILIVIFVLLVLLLVGGFYYAQDYLNKYIGNSITINSTITSATNGEEAEQLQEDISNQKVATDKALKITLSSQNYQSQITQDLNKYATTNGISITEIASTQNPITNNSPINGVQSNFIRLTIANPISYDSFIKFLKAIETNLPKMKLTGISIKPQENTNNYINVEPLIIEVYTK